MTYEQLIRDGLLQFDARDFAAWLTDTVRDIRARRDERERQRAAAEAERKAQAARRAQGNRRAP